MSSRLMQIKLSGMHCEACVASIQKALEAVPGLTEVKVSLAPPLLLGNPALLFKQVKAVGSVGLYSLVMTAGILLVVKVLVGLRVSATEEETGLDLSQHGERAYPKTVLPAVPAT